MTAIWLFKRHVTSYTEQHSPHLEVVVVVGCVKHWTLKLQ